MADESRKKWPSLSSPKGLTCPACGCAHLPVLNTRRSTDRVVRYRQCRYCGKKITTYEVLPAGAQDPNE